MDENREDVAKPEAPTAQTSTALRHHKQAFRIEMLEGSTDAQFAAAVASKMTQPEANAAQVIETWQPGVHDVNVLADELAEQVGSVNAGNLQRAEAMLLSQAHTLDCIFASLAQKVIHQKQLRQWEAFLRMAMKAQNQSRMTLETLANIKNPPVVYARQANITSGPQQVNNGVGGPTRTGASAHAAETATTKTELLEATHGERLDTGTTSAAGRADPVMASLGKVNRPADR